MSMQLFEMKQQREHLLNKADAVLRVAENAHRELTPAEALDVDSCMTAVRSLDPRIKSVESKNTMSKIFPDGRVLPGGGRQFQKPRQVVLSDEYPDAFYTYVQSSGKNMSAALHEGGEGGAGGYLVPITVDNQIVPLAPQEMAIRRLATVIPTVSDIKIPRKGAFGTAALKAESSGSNNPFTVSQPTLEQVTLSAFMSGIVEEVSWELAQDVPAFQAFAVDDMLLAQQMLEEDLYCNGTGNGEAQGLFGNVGAGITQTLSLAGTLDLTGKLNAVYHAGASWLMQRPTSILIRKLQVASNLFEPVWTRVGKQDFLHGYPVEYCAYAPEAESGQTPILFGDFKRGYVIGDRGGSGINVKVLDQPKATLGILQLLVYRRTDGRVRRSEAIQGYTLTGS